MSPKIPALGIVHLLRATNCHRIISEPSLRNLADAVKSIGVGQQWAVHVSNLPKFENVFPTFGCDIVPNVASYPPSKEPFNWQDVMLYMHSSGSTGFPKAIPHRHITSLQWYRNCEFRIPLFYLSVLNYRQLSSLTLATAKRSGELCPCRLFMYLASRFSCSVPS